MHVSMSIPLQKCVYNLLYIYGDYYGHMTEYSRSDDQTICIPYLYTAWTIRSVHKVDLEC